MYSTILETQPKSNQTDEHVEMMTQIGSSSGKIQGNDVHFKSLQYPGKLLSLSVWEDKTSPISWYQASGDAAINNSHFRVMELLRDNSLEENTVLNDPHFNDIFARHGQMVTLIVATRPGEYKETTNPVWCAQFLGLDIYTGPMLLDWDIFESAAQPGILLLKLVWKDCKALQNFEKIDEIDLEAETHHIRHYRVLNHLEKIDTQVISLDEVINEAEPNDAVKSGDEIKFIFEEWHKAITTGDANAIANLYAENAVFESPAVVVTKGDGSDGILNGRESIRIYFEEFFKNIGSDLKDWWRSGTFYGSNGTLTWEYPRQTPTGEQKEIVEYMDIKDGEILNHRVYWGWYGFKNALAKKD